MGWVSITPQGHPESERWGGVWCKPTAGQPVFLDVPVIVSPHSPLMMLCAQQCSGDASLIGLNFRLLKSDRNWGNRLEKVLGPPDVIYWKKGLWCPLLQPALGFLTDPGSPWLCPATLLWGLSASQPG